MEPNNNSKIVKIDEQRKKGLLEAISFLSEYVKDTDRPYMRVADKLGIPIANAKNYLHRYIAAYHSSKQNFGKNFAKALLMYYNKELLQLGIPEENLFKAYYIKQLEPLIAKYDKYEIEKEADEYENEEMEDQSYKETSSNDNDVMSEQNIDPFGFDPYSDDEDVKITDRLREFADSSNVTILREVLRRIPGVPKSAIPNCLELFKMNEDIYMRDINSFKEFIKGFFRSNEALAKMVTDAFVGALHKFGNSEGFGTNPFTRMSYDSPSAYQYGGIGFQNEGGMGNPMGGMMNNPMLMAMMEERERKRRQMDSDEALDRQIARIIKLSTMNLLNNATSGGGSGANGNNMTNMLMTGMFNMVQKMGPDGKPYTALEPRVMGQNAGGESNPEQSLTNILISKMMDFNTQLATKSQDSPKFFESLLQVMLQRTLEKDDPMQQFQNFVQLYEKFKPTGNGGNSIDQLNFMLRKEELGFHKEMEIAKFNAQKDRESHERQLQIEEAKKAENNQKEIFSTIGNIFSQFGPVLLNGVLNKNAGGMSQEQLAAIMAAQQANGGQGDIAQNEPFEDPAQTMDQTAAGLERMRMDQNRANQEMLRNVQNYIQAKDQEMEMRHRANIKESINNYKNGQTPVIDFSKMDESQIQNFKKNAEEQIKLLQGMKRDAEKTTVERTGLKSAFDYEEPVAVEEEKEIDPDYIGFDESDRPEVQVPDPSVLEEAQSKYDFNRINESEQETEYDFDLNPDEIKVSFTEQ